MMFFFGIIVGFFLAVLVFILELILEAKRQKNLTQFIKSKVDKKIRKQPKFFEPPSELEETQKQIIDRNEKHGEGTKAEELGL